MRLLSRSCAADFLVFSVIISREVVKGSEGRVGRPFIIVVVLCKQFSGPVNAVEMSGFAVGFSCFTRNAGTFTFGHVCRNNHMYLFLGSQNVKKTIGSMLR